MRVITCKCCAETQPETNFYLTGKGTRRLRCRTCDNQVARDRREETYLSTGRYGVVAEYLRWVSAPAPTY